MFIRNISGECGGVQYLTGTEFLLGIDNDKVLEMGSVYTPSEYLVSLSWTSTFLFYSNKNGYNETLKICIFYLKEKSS